MIGIGIVINSLLNYFQIYGVQKKEVNLSICVLSARENFQNRNAIRYSWKQSVDQIDSLEENVIVKFIIGSHACHVPKSDRIDVKECDEWTPSVPSESENNEGLALFQVTRKSKPSSVQYVTSLYVKVLEDVDLLRLGISEFIPLPYPSSNYSISAVIYDAVTDEEVTKVFFNQELPSRSLHGFKYRPLEETFTLPKGYEFVIDFELKHLNQNFNEDDSVVNWKIQNDWLSQELAEQVDVAVDESHGDLYRLEYLRDHGTAYDHQPNEAELFPLVSLMFSVSRREHLKQYLSGKSKRLQMWKNDIRQEDSRLEAERKSENDIIMVDLVDVYSNLPEKLLQCHVLLNKQFQSSYVMKTDDDCYLNVPEILNVLRDHHKQDFSWWGNFRRGWKVERFGKWREKHYPGTIYPPFACGTGNVVSGLLHQWLVNNYRWFRRFQGEDVSMGIWLAGLNVTVYDDKRWSCNRNGSEKNFVIGELSHEEIRKRFQSFD